MADGAAPDRSSRPVRADSLGRPASPSRAARLPTHGGRARSSAAPAAYPTAPPTGPRLREHETKGVIIAIPYDAPRPTTAPARVAIRPGVPRAHGGGGRSYSGQRARPHGPLAAPRPPNPTRARRTAPFHRGAVGPWRATGVGAPGSGRAPPGPLADHPPCGLPPSAESGARDARGRYPVQAPENRKRGMTE
ncbi:hypothetical protein GCM10023324_04490 [Streptomyces youssoufiensis]